MSYIKTAKLILAEAKESRSHYAVTQSPFDQVKANMYTIFECYAYGIIDWEVSKTKLQNVIKEYVNLYPINKRNNEIKIMREEYRRMQTEYKTALDTYKLVSETNMTQKLIKNRKLDESVAEVHSNTFYNKRSLTESELKDISTIKTWKRVMEAYPNLTTKDEDRVRMLTIFEAPTMDTTQMINIEMDEGYKILPPMDKEKYQPRDGLEGPFSTLSGKVVYYDPKEGSYYDPDTDMYMSYDEFRRYDDDYKGMKEFETEGHSPHKKGTAKYKKHMAAMHANSAEPKGKMIEGEEKPYICVHAKKGKHECRAESSYAAAKKAAAHWGLKSTAGIDAHLAIDEGKYGKKKKKYGESINESRFWEYSAGTYMVGGNLSYDDKIEYNLSPEDAEILTKFMKQADSDETRKKVWSTFWNSNETGDTAQGPVNAIAYAKKTLGIKENIYNKALQQFDETTSAGAIASVAAPMGKMKRRKDSIFADKETKGELMTEAQFDEAAGEKDACYRKVKSRYKVWPSAYASGALVKCRKVGASNWGNSKK